jgi:hypothetical protein
MKAAILLGILGLAQMTGDVLGIDGLRGLAAATAASPAPKVFSAIGGLETYSSRFLIEWRDRAGGIHSLELTPEVYARLRGPYNRRNAYGAVIAYGPVLASDPNTKALFDGVARYALCGRAPLLRELGIDPDTIDGVVRIRLEPISTSDPGDLPLILVPPCPPSTKGRGDGFRRDRP